MVTGKKMFRIDSEDGGAPMHLEQCSDVNSEGLCVVRMDTSVSNGSGRGTQLTFGILDVTNKKIFGSVDGSRGYMFPSGHMSIQNQDGLWYPVSRSGDRAKSLTSTRPVDLGHLPIRVYRKGRVYFIDKSGKNAFGRKSFRDAGPFIKGVAEVWDKKEGWFLIDTGGNRISNIYELSIEDRNGDRFVCRNSDGSQTLLRSDGKEVGHGKLMVIGDNHGPGLRLVQSCKEDGALWGFMDDDGNFVIPCSYIYAQEFSAGATEVGVTGRDGRKSIIDIKGKEIPVEHPSIWHCLKSPSKELRVGSDDNSLVIFRGAHVLYRASNLRLGAYDSAFNYGQVCVVDKDTGKYGHITRNGKIIGDRCEYDFCEDYRDDGTATVNKGQGDYKINLKGEEVIPTATVST